MDSERLKNKNKGDDIISRMPDDVLAHILSRLEAKDAFRTSILSSRWKYLWTLIYNIHFQLPFYIGNREALFLKFVEHVLCHFRSKDIQEFHIGSFFGGLDIDAAHISKLISFAVERNVSSLSLEVDLPMDRLPVMIRLPQSILACKRLVRLALGSWDITLDIPDSVACFPNLKFLSIFVGCPDANLMQKLFRSCPVLEELIIDSVHAENENVLTFDITVPTLKKLKMNLSSTFVNGVLSNRYVVRAPNLECLAVCNDFLACCMVGETPFLKKLILVGEVHLSFCKSFNDESNNWATEFFRAISNTRCLSLSSSIILELSASTRYINLQLPLFPNLIHLDVGIEMLAFPALLFQFLNNSPNLEVLVLVNVVDDDDDEEGVQVEFEGVPSCMLLHLKKVYVSGVDRRNARLEVVKFLLENSQVLERFAASFGESTEEELELRNEILNFPRASPICEIEFVESSYINKLSHKLYED